MGGKVEMILCSEETAGLLQVLLGGAVRRVQVKRRVVLQMLDLRTSGRRRRRRVGAAERTRRRVIARDIST